MVQLISTKEARNTRIAYIKNNEVVRLIVDVYRIFIKRSSLVQRFTLRRSRQILARIVERGNRSTLCDQRNARSLRVDKRVAVFFLAR